MNTLQKKRAMEWVMICIVMRKKLSCEGHKLINHITIYWHMIVKNYEASDTSDKSYFISEIKLISDYLISKEKVQFIE